MKKFLLIKVVISLLFFYTALLLLIFIPAGSIKFFEGWMYFGIFFIATNILTFYFLKTNPALIERRTQTEKEKTQIIIQSLNAMMFIALLIIPGLDFRNHWTDVPLWLQVTAIILISFGFLIVFFVFKQNSFLASNIKAYEDQKVITTGLYSIVRHPMYSGAYLIILFTPIALGSYWSFIPAGIISILIFLRTLNEEKILKRDLKGYKEYYEEVHYRYFPGIL